MYVHTRCVDEYYVILLSVLYWIHRYWVECLEAAYITTGMITLDL